MEFSAWMWGWVKEGNDGRRLELNFILCKTKKECIREAEEAWGADYKQLRKRGGRVIRVVINPTLASALEHGLVFPS